MENKYKDSQNETNSQIENDENKKASEKENQINQLDKIDENEKKNEKNDEEEKIPQLGNIVIQKNPGQDAQAVVKPYPLADKALQKQILDLLYHAKDFKQVKKGSNEVIKTLRRGYIVNLLLFIGLSQFVIMAADTKPLEMLMIVPQLCEEKDVPYCFIESQAALGRACGSRRPAIAATINSDEGSQLNGEIEVMRDLIQQLFI